LTGNGFQGSPSFTEELPKETFFQWKTFFLKRPPSKADFLPKKTLSPEKASKGKLSRKSFQGRASPKVEFFSRDGFQGSQRA